MSVGLKQTPPGRDTTDVNGMLVPVTLNEVATPTIADAGENDAMTGAPVSGNGACVVVAASLISRDCCPIHQPLLAGVLLLTIAVT